MLLRLFSFLLMACGLLVACRQEEAVPARPNILFAIADDVTFAHLGAYGCQWVQSPAFDRVAREGILFQNAYTPNAKCAPSRSCILTGRNSWQLEEGANHWPYFPAKFKTFPEALSENGYFVGHTAKGWGPGVALDANGQKRLMTGRTFNQIKTTPPAGHISDIDYAANFAAFLDSVPQGQPFCFWYGGLEPHRAYEFGASLRVGGKQLTDIDQVPPFWPDTDSVRTDLLDYAFELEYFDQHLGQMLAALEAKGLLDNTIVVVTADNGMPFPMAKGQSYEFSNHLPLAIRWPQGIAGAGRKVADYVSFIDFAATFLEVAGLTAAQVGMQPITGRSLTDIFRTDKSGQVVPERDHVLIGKERHDVGRPNDVGYPIRGMVKNGAMYLHNFEPDRWPAGNPETGYLNIDGGATKSVLIARRKAPEGQQFWQFSMGKRGQEEFFWVDKDPYCIQNKALDPEFSSQVSALREQLFAELKAQGDPRVLGNGAVFDQYPYADPSGIHFYERYMSGEEMKAGWVNPSDFQKN